MALQTTNVATALSLNTFTRSGYTFNEWNTQANGSGSVYANGASYLFTSSAALYAQWTANSYTVTFNANGGAGSMASQSASTAESIYLNAFTRSGYIFTGWNTAPSGSGTSYANGASYPFTSSATLYAQWTANTDTVTFNANGGTGSMVSQTYNKATALSLNSFTRGGYTFNGWNTVAGGGGTGYADGASYPFTSSATLYAQWTANSYTVSFNANGGTGSMVAQTYNAATALSLNSFTRAGYTFTEWNTQANGSGSGYADGDIFEFTGPATMYAQWTANVNTVTFVSNGGTGSMGAESSSSLAHLSANVFTRAGYTFSNWNTQPGGGGTSYADGGLYGFSASITLYAQWTGISYTVTFNANGGAGSMAAQTRNTATALSLDTFTRGGYTFNGWNTLAGGNGTSFANGASYPFTSSTTLYAQWSLNSYTVTFNANGGTGSMASQSDSSPTDLNSNVFTYAGHTFTGWNTAAGGSGTSYSDAGSYAFSSSVTLFAQWVTTTYTVTFNANGGTGSMASQSSNTPADLNADTLTRSGYLFAGWNTAAGGNGTSYSDAGYYAFSSSMTLYAQWAVAYTVTFNANGGTGSMSAQIADSPAGLSGNTFTWSGHTFTGWNTAANGSGTSYGNGGYYAFSSSMTLYAQWAVAFTVTFNANGGAGVMSSQSSSSATNLNANTFTYSGYTFTGWNTQAGGGGTSYSNGATYAFTSSVTLYAQWTTGATVSESTNWSGYVLTGASGGYQSVSGSWVVPVLNCSVTPNSAVSIWVGVNGASSSYPGLFQTGTTSLCTNGVESSYAWWTDEQMNYMAIELYGVSTGNTINASVFQGSGGTWSYSVSDPSSSQSSTSAEAFSGSGLCAEWIVEDPGTGGGLYTMADFSSVSITNMNLASPVTGPTLPPYSEIVNMETPGGTQEDSTGAVSGAAFTVTQMGT
jgi:uncharacterized repeat protein (TIGR02543 family)